jgi:hypothetical protein
MEAKYLLELEDFVALNQHLQDKEDQQKGFSYTTFVVMTGVGCIVLAGVAAYLFIAGNPETALACGFTSVVGAYMFFSVVRNRVVSLRALRQRLREETKQEMSKEHSVRLTATGVIDTCDGVTQSVPWSSVKDVETGRGCVFIFTDGGVWIIPGRCFGGKADLEEFAGAARRYRTGAERQA